MSILFGNLGSRSHNQDTYAVCGLDHQNHDAGRLIAHDVIEHTIAHRTDNWVTVAEEIRALGAVNFVRPQTQTLYDIVNQLQYLATEPTLVIPPKRDMLDDFSGSILDAMEDEDLEANVEVAEWAMAQVNYGYWQKHNQYQGDMHQAWTDFEFIRRNSNDAVDLLIPAHWDEGVSGITCSFDTQLHTFRTQFKHQ